MSDEFSPQAIKALTLIAKELPLKEAAAIVAELYGYKKMPYTNLDWII